MFLHHFSLSPVEELSPEVDSPPMVLATLSHRACNYFILYFPGGFCHTKPPGELYFWWINKDPGIISRSWVSVTRICHHYQQLLYRRNFTVTSSGLKKIQGTLAAPGSVLQEHWHHYPQLLSRRNCEVHVSRVLIETTRKSGKILICCLNWLTTITI